MSQVPVNDLGAEAAVLSACLLKPEVIPTARAVLDPKMFYSSGHGSIFDALCSLHAAGQSVDVVQVSSWLRGRGQLAMVGGLRYVTSIVDSTPSVSNVVEHAKIVRAKAQQRLVVRMAHRILSEGYDDVPDVGEWAGEWLRDLTEIVNAATSSDAGQHIGGAIKSAFERVNDTAKGNVGIRTGLVDLDRMLGGLRPGQVTIIAARSHVGKSSLARQIAATVASAGDGVFVWSGEQGYDELGECMTYQQSGVAAANMADPNRNTTDDWRRLTEAANGLYTLPIWINDRPGISPIKLRGAVRERKIQCASEKRTLKLVVVDYVQLMSARGLTDKGANREQQVSAISKALKELAMGEQVTLIVCAQLNKEGGLRESDALKQDADKLITIHNDGLAERMKVYRMGGRFALPESEQVDVVVEKARGGGTLGRTQITFYPTCGRFETTKEADNDRGYAA